MKSFLIKFRDKYLVSDAVSELNELKRETKFLSKRVTELRNLVSALKYDLFSERYASLVCKETLNLSAFPIQDSVLRLLNVVGATAKTFVEIGPGRSGGNVELLAEHFGWNGLFVDASSGAIAKLRKKFWHSPNLQFRSTIVTPENVNDIIDETGFKVIDIVSIDIDSYDYWVFDAVTTKARIFIVEYNPYFGNRNVGVKKDSITNDAPKFYKGASLRALVNVAKRKGYRLVGYDQNGNNAFFILNELAPQIPTLNVKQVNVERTNRMTGLPTDPNHRAKELRKIEEAGLQLAEFD